jgi:hypothetical protein
MVRELVPFVPGSFPLADAMAHGDREHEDVSGLAD